ncbi:MAG: hypothetical protein VXW65_10390 [Pseudomonadota bacterium]|nr:hypothetical protein [Pseudomonadota bacterium]
MAVFYENLGVISPLQQEKELYFLSGNKPHQGGTDMAAVVIDPIKDVINVYLQTDGKLTVLTERQQRLPVPKDIQTLFL